METKPTVFVREATGLVREIGFWGSLGYSTGWMAYLPLYALTLPTIAGVLPGADLFTGFFIAWVIQLITVFSYLFLSVAMPRSGGDYVWVSRSVHPALGFMSGWAWWLSAFLFTGANIYFVMTFFLPSTLTLVANATGNTEYLALGTALSQPLPTFLIGMLLVIPLALASILGTRWPVRVISVSGIVGIIALLALFGALLQTSPASFNSSFAAFANHNSTQQVVNAATKAGFAEQPLLSATLASVPIWMVFSIAGSQYMVYLAGEVRQVKRNLTLSLIANMVIVLIIWSVGTLIFVNSIGKQVYEALSYLWINFNPSYPVPGGIIPSPQTIGYIANSNLTLTVFIGFATMFSSLAGSLSYFPWVSRVLLAMSFDRMLPSRLADVNDRFHTPIKALLVVTVGTVITVALWIEGFASTLLNGSIILAVIYTIGGIGSIAFPLKMKSTFESSPVNYKVGKLPVISILGVATVVSWLIILWAALTNSALGALGLPIYTFAIALFLSGVVAYFVIKAYWRSKGIDTTLAFREIPPE